MNTSPVAASWLAAESITNDNTPGAVASIRESDDVGATAVRTVYTLIHEHSFDTGDAIRTVVDALEGR